MVPVLYIILPCYNEEAALPITAAKLTELTDDMISRSIISPESKIMMVDDGSSDATWEVIEKLSASDGRFTGVKLAHNAGHMNALWAGMTRAVEKCDCLITIDADLQDDVNAMYGFLENFNDGCDVVYGVRGDRKTDTFFKRFTAQGFYKLMDKLGVETVYNHADYRLLSRRAAVSLLSFSEVNMFLRAMVPRLGYKSAKVYYSRGERVAGESKYPLKKMLAFAIDGITSFSIKPIRLLVLSGIIFALLGVAMAVYALISRISGHYAGGWPSLMMSIWFLGGLQLIGLGIVGEYIGKIYLETKRRPKFIIEKEV